VCVRLNPLARIPLVNALTLLYSSLLVNFLLLNIARILLVHGALSY
jgi:hypothetical protein